MSNNYIKTLDPIQGLYDYVQDIKPYHTKIMEVLIEYVYDDDVKTIFDEQLQLSWGPTKFPFATSFGSPVVPGPTTPFFSIVAAQVAGAPPSQYTGADPTNIIGGGVLGSIDQGTLSNLTVVVFYTYGTNTTTASSITLGLSTLGSAAASDSFSSIEFTDQLGVPRLLDRSTSDDPLGYDATTYREWTWQISPAAQIFSVGNSYTITVNGTAVGSPALPPIGSPVGSPGSYNNIFLSGDFTNAATVGELVTLIVDGVRSEHTIDTISYLSGITTIGVSPPYVDGTSTSVLIPHDVVPFFSFDVTEINAEENYILVSGPATATIFSGQELMMMGSSLNDGELIVTGSPTFNGLVTKIPVVGPLNEETVGSPIPVIEPLRYFVP